MPETQRPPHQPRGEPKARVFPRTRWTRVNSLADADASDDDFVFNRMGSGQPGVTQTRTPRRQGQRLLTHDHPASGSSTGLAGDLGTLPLNPFGHQGLLHDGEALGLPGHALVYNRARHLHTTLGRFQQRDPLGYVDGMSVYQYLRSNPTIHLDPVGEEAEMKISAPPANWLEWGFGDRSKGNCWRYACNDRLGPNNDLLDDDLHSPIPGGADPGGILTCEFLKQGAVHDGASYSDDAGDCPSCHYRVALVIESEDDAKEKGRDFNDFHWYREQGPWQWTHKRGRNIIEETHDPWEHARNNGYSIHCGYMCIPEGGVDLDD